MTLQEWARAALAHGRVYVVCEYMSRTNMSAGYNLYTVVQGTPDGYNRDGLRFEIAWPFERDTDGQTFSRELAKRLGFRINTTRRCFVRGGCGYALDRDVLLSIFRETHPDMNSNDVQNAITLESLNRS